MYLHRKVTTDVNLRVEVTPKELALMFCDLFNHEQVEFFNEIGKLDLQLFQNQMLFVKSGRKLTKRGKIVMSIVGRNFIYKED